MNDEKPWTNDLSTLDYARVLRAVVEASEPHSAVEADDVAEVLGIEPERVGVAFDRLVQDELVTDLGHRMSDTHTSAVVVEPGGRARVAGWDAAYASSSGRGAACRSALLAWLDTDAASGATSTDDFQQSPLSYFTGVSFEDELVMQSARELRDLGLIDGIATWGGPVVRPGLTTLGTTVLQQYGGDVARWQAGPAAASTTITVTGSPGANVASASPGAEQHSSVQIGAGEGLERLAAALETMLKTSAEALELDPADLAQAYALIPELHAAAEDVDQDPSRARRALATLGDITKEGTGSVLGSALWALAVQVATTLPL